MKITAEQLRQTLESELDPGAVEGDASVVQRYAVDGKQPTLICSPATPEQVALALRLCSAAEAAITKHPTGASTAAALQRVFKAVRKARRDMKRDATRPRARSQSHSGFRIWYPRPDGRLSHPLFHPANTPR